jgi:hypothetical protein
VTPPSVFCNTCKRWKRPDVMARFNKDRTTGHCKACVAARQRRWRAANPEKAKRIERTAYAKLRADPERWRKAMDKHAKRMANWRAKKTRVELNAMNRAQYKRRRDERPEAHREYLKKQYAYQKKVRSDPDKREHWLALRRVIAKRSRLKRRLTALRFGSPVSGKGDRAR